VQRPTARSRCERVIEQAVRDEKPERRASSSVMSASSARRRHRSRTRPGCGLPGAHPGAQRQTRW
jgi:hypothetical protein